MSHSRSEEEQKEIISPEALNQIKLSSIQNFSFGPLPQPLTLIETS